MINILQRVSWYIILIIALLYCSCNKDEAQKLICGEDPIIGYLPCFDSILPYYERELSLSPKFNKTDTIFIPEFHIYDLPFLHHMRGDASLYDLIGAESCCDLLNHIDTVLNEPRLVWYDPENYKLKAVAIFDKQIKLTKDGQRILNTEDIVWTWNSGMDSGYYYDQKMEIKYSWGKMVHSASIAEGPVVPLVSGKIYSWLVWAWNDNGTQVIASSREIPFIVNGIKTISVESVRQIEGTWHINKLTNADGDEIIDDDFPISEIYFNRYCYIDHRKWEDRYSINPTDTSQLELDHDTLYLTKETEIPKFFNPRMRCDELFHAKCYFKNNLITVEFLRDVSEYIPVR